MRGLKKITKVAIEDYDKKINGLLCKICRVGNLRPHPEAETKREFIGVERCITCGFTRKEKP